MQMGKLSSKMWKLTTGAAQKSETQEDLSVYNGLVLEKNRDVYILSTLRSTAVYLTHGGHKGIVKTKELQSNTESVVHMN